MKLYAAITLAAAAVFAPLNAVGAEPEMLHAEQSAENSGGGISPLTVGIIVAGALGATTGGVALGRKSAVRIEPSPLAVDVTQQMLPREDFEKYRAEQAKEIANVHARIDRLAPSVAEIKGRLDHISTTQTTILNLLLKDKQ